MADLANTIMRRRVRCTRARLQGPRVQLMPNIRSIDSFNHIGGFFPSPRSPCESTDSGTMMPSAARPVPAARRWFLFLVIWANGLRWPRTMELAAFKIAQNSLTLNDFTGLSLPSLSFLDAGTKFAKKRTNCRSVDISFRACHESHLITAAGSRRISSGS